MEFALDLPGNSGVQLPAELPFRVNAIRQYLGMVLLDITIGEGSAKAFWFPYRNVFTIASFSGTELRRVHQIVRYSFYCPPFFEENEKFDRVSPEEGKLNEAFFASPAEYNSLSDGDREILGSRNTYLLRRKYLEELANGKYLNDASFHPLPDLIVVNNYLSLGILTEVVDWMSAEVVIGRNGLSGSFTCFLGSIFHNPANYRDCYLRGNFAYNYETRTVTIELTGRTAPDSVNFEEDELRLLVSAMWLPGTAVSFKDCPEYDLLDSSLPLTQIWSS